MPRSLGDVPAERLAFRFEPDVKDEVLPQRVKSGETEEPLASIKADFEGRRGNTRTLNGQSWTLPDFASRCLRDERTETDFKLISIPSKANSYVIFCRTT